MDQPTSPADRANPVKYAAAADYSLGMWRYRDLLPQVDPVTLGEGWTPLLRSRRCPGLYLKDEGRNPHGNVADRGISLAVSVARAQGRSHLALTGTAAAAYAAAAQLTLSDAQPADLPALLLEGEKTLGYELCEQFHWLYPEAIFCALALIPALWQAFDVLERRGWLPEAGPRPRIFTFAGEADLAVLHQSGGRRLDVTRQQTADAAHHEGLFLSPEGAAALAAYTQLSISGELPPGTRAVVINPALGRPPIPLPTSMPVGGIITPV